MGGMSGGRGGGANMGWQGGPGAMMGGANGMGMMSAMAGHVEGRIAFVKAELRITKAQQPRWDAAADAMQANADRHVGADDGGHSGAHASRGSPPMLRRSMAEAAESGRVPLNTRTLA